MLIGITDRFVEMLRGDPPIARLVNRSSTYQDIYERTLQAVQVAAGTQGIDPADPDVGSVASTMLLGEDGEIDESRARTYLEEAIRFTSALWRWSELAPGYWQDLKELDDVGTVYSEDEAYKAIERSFGEVERYLDQTEAFLETGRSFLEIDVSAIMEQEYSGSGVATTLFDMAAGAASMYGAARYDRELARVQEAREAYRQNG